MTLTMNRHADAGAAHGAATAKNMKTNDVMTKRPAQVRKCDSQHQQQQPLSELKETRADSDKKASDFQDQLSTHLSIVVSAHPL
jgi:hypothetical protein